jgi:hypothetical protein
MYSLCPGIVVVLGLGETTKKMNQRHVCPYIAVRT